MAKNIKYAIGVDLGGTSIKLGIVSETGKIIYKTSLETKAEAGPEKVVAQIKKGINQLLDKKKFSLRAIGIGCPGVVSIKKGTVENPPNFPGWRKVNLGRILEKEFKKKVYVENDANAAAIGEMIFGAGRKYNSFVMITLGTGVGGGIILNKKLYRGDFGAAGELGHITIDYRGEKCNCGSYGCVETYLGNNYLIRRLKTEIDGHATLLPELVQNDLDKLTPKTIKEAADKGDQFAINFIKELGVYLGSALGSVSNLLDVSTFIIGGGVAGFADYLFDAVRETVASRVMIPIRPRVKVLPAKLKNEAGILGASALVYYRS
jgi:glucokinase